MKEQLRCAYVYPSGAVCGLPAWADGGATVHTTLRYEEDPASRRRRGLNPEVRVPPHRFVPPSNPKRDG
ncbi:MAG: hypothetical protein KGI98_12135 [Euryarchaeota archaeon]|nr:hypothetical protein [Euryarchaeota archaeon]MDE1881597.1 hypothetical protein [Euryarchaeota archaeon]